MNQYIKAIAPIVHKLPKHKRKAAIEFTDYTASNYIKEGHSYFGKKILFIGDV